MELYREARNDARKKFITEVFLKSYRLMSYDELQDEMIFPREEFEKYYNVYKNPKTLSIDQSNNWLLTIRSRDDKILWSDLSKIAKRICEYKNLLDSPQLEYEQSSEDITEPSGYHLHIACRILSNPKDVLKRTIAAVKREFGECEPNWVDLRRCHSAYEYVKGEKDEDKMKKVIIDQKLRENKILYYP